MKTHNTLATEPAPRSVLGIPAKAGIQWSPKSAYFWFNDILDSGRSLSWRRPGPE